MVRAYEKIFWLVLLIAGLLPVGYGADDMSGSAAAMKNFALPEYSRDNGRLQFIVYGTEARNLGAMILLSQPMIDIVKNDVTNIQSIVSLAGIRPYPLIWTAGQVADFWKGKQHSQALIFADAAEYDKNLRLLRGDSKVHFRTPELSVDGVGFDADQDRKFVHIRSKVKVILYPAARKKSGVRKEENETRKEKK